MTVHQRPLATPEQLSEYLGVPVDTVLYWRQRGIGPRGAKIGRHVRYRWEDVDAWVAQQTGAVSA